MAKGYPGLNFGDTTDWKDVNPAILSGLSRLAQSSHQTISIASGFRTYEEQKILYQRYIDSGKDIRYIAAPPGSSEHESGNAVDANVNGTPLANFYTSQQLHKFGLSAPVDGDPVHIQLASKSDYKTAGTGGGDISSGTGDIASTPAPVLFNTQPAHPSDIQQNTGVSAAGPGMQPTQLADLWNQIANQQYSSPESSMFAQNSEMSKP